jgi:alpha-L-fucosidase
MGEGPTIPASVPPDWKGGSTADQTTAIKEDPGSQRPRVQMTEATFRFTAANGALYAWGMRFPAGGAATIRSLSTKDARVEKVTLLGAAQPVPFKQSADGLVVTLPAKAPIEGMPYGLKIEGSEGLGLA